MAVDLNRVKSANTQVSDTCPKRTPLSKYVPFITHICYIIHNRWKATVSRFSFFFRRHEWKSYGGRFSRVERPGACLEFSPRRWIDMTLENFPEWGATRPRPSLLRKNRTLRGVRVTQHGLLLKTETRSACMGFKRGFGSKTRGGR